MQALNYKRMNVRRWKRSLLIAAVGLLIGKTPLFAQQTDPALTSAVLGQTAALKKIHKDRKKTQEKIIAAEVAVTASLERIHQVEDKMLDYLSNAQGAMQNLYQIKRAGELVQGNPAELQSAPQIGRRQSEGNRHCGDGRG